MRKLMSTIVRQQELVDVFCDICGKSVRGQLNPDRFELARIVARFDEGVTAGDRFKIDLCQGCFFDLLEWLLLDRKGVCDYTNVVDQGDSATIDDLREYFGHRRAGTLTPEEDFEPSEPERDE